MPAIRGATRRFMLGVLVEVAELEAGLIGERTKAALAAAKARGVRLGGDRGHRHQADDARRWGAEGAAKGREAADSAAERASVMIAEVTAGMERPRPNGVATALNEAGARRLAVAPGRQPP